MTPSAASFQAEEPVRELRRLGAYTEREAAFLWLVATHSGYFLARQFDQFIGCRPGKARDAFVTRLLANRDGSATVQECGQALYHVSARPLYNALGQADNRNRRARPTPLIRARLMALDFVLSHPGASFLPYGQERADWFVRECQMGLSELPAKRYAGRDGSPPATRYFVDKFPVFLSGATAQPPVVSFCYIDEGQVTRKGFETYLAQYEKLFRALPHFALVYVAATRSRVRETEAVFQRFLHQNQAVPRPAENRADLDSLLKFFPLRAAHEAREYRALSKENLTTLRAGLQQLQGPQIDEWFALWKQGGRVALEAAGVALVAGKRPLQAEFSCCLLPHNYQSFSARVEGHS